MLFKKKKKSILKIILDLKIIFDNYPITLDLKIMFLAAL